MGKYSRTRKYEELRNRMQNENETDITNHEFAQMNRRMNELNGTNLTTDAAQDHDPIHARFPAAADTPKEAPVSSIAASLPDFDTGFLRNNENFTNTFNNEYLNEYIREAKQYNVDHGTALSGNTNINILRTIRGEQPALAPAKPYEDKDKKEDTIPVFDTPKKEEQSFATNTLSDFLDSLENTEEVQTGSETTGMTREDIAAEVQNLIHNSDSRPTSFVSKEPEPHRPDSTAIISEAVAESDEQKTQRQLLKETTQMRAQLNDYQDDLSEVSNKMKRTNHILNIVLIVLIIALSVVLLVVIYWVLQSRGVF